MNMLTVLASSGNSSIQVAKLSDTSVFQHDVQVLKIMRAEIGDILGPSVKSERNRCDRCESWQSSLCHASLLQAECVEPLPGSRQ